MKKNILLLLALMMFAGVVRANYWNVENIGLYEDYSTVTAVVKINGIEQTSTQLELGAFCNGVVRGSVYAIKYKERYLFRLKCYGNPGDKFSLRLYDAEHEIELNNLECDFIVNYGESLGSPNSPQVIEFNSVVSTYELPITGYGSSTGGYHLISSPVTAEIEPSATNGFISGNYDLYYFDQTQELEWINFEAGAFAIESGKGYLYASEGGTTLQFTGTAYSGDGIVPLVYSEANPSTNMHGWNLIGNPFPQDATINRACYVMNTNGTELASAASGTLIPAMNGVFVKAEAEGESVTFTPSTSGSGTEVAKVVLNVLRDRAATLDRAIVCFDENSTLPKFMLDSNNTKVYIPESGEQFAVVSSARQNSLPVNFKAKESGTYTLSVDINNIEMEYLHLIDNMTGADIDLLQQPNYQFNASTSDYESRFMLAFRAETGVEEQGQESFCFVNGRSLYFCEDVEGATLSLVDMTGRMVRNESLKGNGVSLDNLSEGVYVVRLAKGNDVKTQKVVVR